MLINIEAMEQIERLCVVYIMVHKLWAKDGHEVSGTEYAVNADNGNVTGVSLVVRGNDPHPIVWIGFISEHGEPVNEGALVWLVVKIKREK